MKHFLEKTFSLSEKFLVTKYCLGPKFWVKQNKTTGRSVAIDNCGYPQILASLVAMYLNVNRYICIISLCSNNEQCNVYVTLHTQKNRRHFQIEC